MAETPKLELVDIQPIILKLEGRSLVFACTRRTPNTPKLIY